MRLAHIELKTRPDYCCQRDLYAGGVELHTACRVESTGRGSVVIWMVLPTRFAMMNMSMPSYAARRQREASEKRVAILSYLPAAAPVGRTANMVFFLLLFEQMRLALQGQADALDAG